MQDRIESRAQQPLTHLTRTLICTYCRRSLQAVGDVASRLAHQIRDAEPYSTVSRKSTAASRAPTSTFTPVERTSVRVTRWARPLMAAPTPCPTSSWTPGTSLAAMAATFETTTSAIVVRLSDVTSSVARGQATSASLQRSVSAFAFRLMRLPCSPPVAIVRVHASFVESV
jgi:hypothetical protein